MVEMLEGGQLDYLTGDYLAELTMLILGRDRMKDPNLGYAKTFVRQLKDSLRLAHERGVTIVANAGGLNPSGLAGAIRELALDQGIDVPIAYVDGDDVRDRAPELGAPDALAANAYLGAFGIADALRAGARIVVTGRVTDASVVVGPAIHAFDWRREQFNELAGAVVAGHVIECGTQATGGNFSGFRSFDRTKPLGFPIAEIAPDGSSVITKHADTGGAVTIDTVTAQLVYEIQDERYYNPDVTVHFDSIELNQQGTDRVSITNVHGGPPPSRVKVGINRLGGFRNVVEFVLTGLDIEDKAEWVRAQMEAGMARNLPESIEWDLQRTDHSDPDTQAKAAALYRCSVKSMDPEKVGRSFTNSAIEIALASYPGFHVTAPPKAGVPFGVFTAGYLSQSEVPHRVTHADGSVSQIATPESVSDIRAAGPLYIPPTWEPSSAQTQRVPLGRVAHARSGDKGGNANIGIWIGADHPNRDRAWAWLCAELTPERIRELLPEARDLDLSVTYLPRIKAINIVIDGILGDGVAAGTRHDPQAKALGEWLRARLVDVEEDLIHE
jgi:hypothetical protein